MNCFVNKGIGHKEECVEVNTLEDLVEVLREFGVPAGVTPAERGLEIGETDDR